MVLTFKELSTHALSSWTTKFRYVANAATRLNSISEFYDVILYSHPTVI